VTTQSTTVLRIAAQGSGRAVVHWTIAGETSLEARNIAAPERPRRYE